MNRSATVIIGCCLLMSLACREAQSPVVIPEPVKTSYGKDSLKLSPEIYHDKVLGALVGSAIGDAMGASTEMWHRKDIQSRYGYITGLTAAIRNQSPEGTWEHNLGAGATTDDTRWKLLMVKYLNQTDSNISPASFAEFILDYYKVVAGGLDDKELLANPDLLDAKLEKVDWIREWARVAMAYQQNPGAYQNALNRFYGGEMACAGMLYTPMFGLKAPNPEQAYKTAYGHSLFDHGYARDISGLVAAMTQMALQSNDMDAILKTAVFVDPERFQDSRLVGRISLDIAQGTRQQVRIARDLVNPGGEEEQALPSQAVPAGYPGSPDDWWKQEYIYAFLEKEQKAIPFHAGEIWQILIAGLEYGQGDFDKTMQFIVNYGRDNDTVAAVAGMILGARIGFNGLPDELKNTVLKTNREQLGIDLENLARELSGLHENPAP